MMESMWIKDAKILVDAKGDGWVVDGDPALIAEIDGPACMDNQFEGVPKTSGLYACRVEFMFSAGGGEEPEDDWEFHVVSAVLCEEPAMAQRLRELEARHETQDAKIKADAEQIDRLKASLALSVDNGREAVDRLKALALRAGLDLDVVREVADIGRVVAQILEAPEEAWSKFHSVEYLEMEVGGMQRAWTELGRRVGIETEEGCVPMYWHVQAVVQRMLEEASKRQNVVS